MPHLTPLTALVAEARAEDLAHAATDDRRRRFRDGGRGLRTHAAGVLVAFALVAGCGDSEAPSPPGAAEPASTPSASVDNEAYLDRHLDQVLRDNHRRSTGPGW